MSRVVGYKGYGPVLVLVGTALAFTTSTRAHILIEIDFAIKLAVAKKNTAASLELKHRGALPAVTHDGAPRQQAHNSLSHTCPHIPLRRPPLERCEIDTRW